VIAPLLLAPLLAQGPEPLTQERAAAWKSERQAFAVALRAEIEALGKDADAAARLARGQRVLEEARERFPGSRTAERLRRAEERLRAEAGAPAAVLSTWQAVVADLLFEPTVEAEVPAGYPPATPAGEVVLLEYPVSRMAVAEGGPNGAFWQLFRHIERHEIAMTAPVRMEYPDSGPSTMAFLYGSTAIGELGPDGSRVRVVETQPELVVSLGVRGLISERSRKNGLAMLRRWIELHPELEVAGAPRTMGWNSPMMPRDRSFQELQIPVRRKAPAEPSGSPTAAR
jgi:hypothetical protein